MELGHGTKGNTWVYGHGECLKMAVFGEAVKSLFIAEGIDPERIVVTGNPKFDKLYYSKSHNCRQKVCEKWDISPEKDIIVLLTQYNVEAKIWSAVQRRNFVLAITKAVAAIPNTQLIIKLHPPLESEEDYQEIVRDLIPRPAICKYTSLSELLNASSLVLAGGSTAALEAMAIEKPVVMVNLFNDFGPDYFQDSGAIHAEREADILPAIERALYDSQLREEMARSMEIFVHEQAYIQDGYSSARIANLIRDMATSK